MKVKVNEYVDKRCLKLTFDQSLMDKQELLFSYDDFGFGTVEV